MYTSLIKSYRVQH